MPGNDPWLIIMTATTQAQAHLMIRAMREVGIELPTAVCRRSEARAVLAEAITPEAKVYNKAALDAIEEDKQTVGRIMAEKEAKRANNRRLQSDPKTRLRRA